MRQRLAWCAAFEAGLYPLILPASLVVSSGQPVAGAKRQSMSRSLVEVAGLFDNWNSSLKQRLGPGWFPSSVGGLGLTTQETRLKHWVGDMRQGSLVQGGGFVVATAILGFLRSTHELRYSLIPLASKHEMVRNVCRRSPGNLAK